MIIFIEDPNFIETIFTEGSSRTKAITKNNNRSSTEIFHVEYVVVGYWTT